MFIYSILLNTVNNARNSYSLFAQTEAGKSIILLLHEAGNDAEKARKNLENWYNDAMDRVGGWYKQKTQAIIFAIAFVVCSALNIDAIKISQTLWTDIALRQALVQAASSAEVAGLMPQSPAKQSTEEKSTGNDDGVGKETVESPKDIGKLIKKIEELHLPIGWTVKDGEEKKWIWVSEKFEVMDWLVKFMGILITTFAGSLGAPFWFQLLNKIVDLRAAGKQPGKSNVGT